MKYKLSENLLEGSDNEKYSIDKIICVFQINSFLNQTSYNLIKFDGEILFF